MRAKEKLAKSLENNNSPRNREPEKNLEQLQAIKNLQKNLVDSLKLVVEKVNQKSSMDVDKTKNSVDATNPIQVQAIKDQLKNIVDSLKLFVEKVNQKSSMDVDKTSVDARNPKTNGYDLQVQDGQGIHVIEALINKLHEALVPFSQSTSPNTPQDHQTLMNRNLDINDLSTSSIDPTNTENNGYDMGKFGIPNNANQDNRINRRNSSNVQKHRALQSHNSINRGNKGIQVKA
jgi:hypothetical protein